MSYNKYDSSRIYKLDKVAGVQSGEHFFGTKEEWDALSYAQQKAWVNQNKKVTIINDYVAKVKQNVAGCIASTSEDDVAGASALVDANTYDATEKVVGICFGKPLYRVCVEGTLGNENENKVVIPITNVNVWSLKALVSTTDELAWYMLPAYKTTDALEFCRVYYHATNGVRIDNRFSSYFGGRFRIIFEYTKD